MIKAKLSDGTILLGIDAENVRRLQDGKPIRLNLSDVGGPDQVIGICYGHKLSDILHELGLSLSDVGVPTRGN